MATTKRKTKRKGPETRGRKPSTETVKVTTLARSGKSLRTARLIFSEDVVFKLLDLHERLYASFYYDSRADRLARLRFQFGRLSDTGIPGLFVRVEPPSYDPRGSRVRRVHKRRTFYCQILCKKLGLRDGIKVTNAELMWHDSIDDMLHNGLYLMLPDNYVLPPRPDAAGPENFDLTVR